MPNLQWSRDVSIQSPIAATADESVGLHDVTHHCAVFRKLSRACYIYAVLYKI